MDYIESGDYVAVLRKADPVGKRPRILSVDSRRADSGRRSHSGYACQVLQRTPRERTWVHRVWGVCIRNNLVVSMQDHRNKSSIIERRIIEK
jgi:hypothetical protein